MSATPPGKPSLLPCIESLIFCSPQPITAKEISDYLKRGLGMAVSEATVEAGVRTLGGKYREGPYSFQIENLGGGYVFVLKTAYCHSAKLLLQAQSRRRLSVACLETLSIIAYKQPITKSTIEGIRGVNSDHTLHKLLEKNLICAKKDMTHMGRALLYETAPQFMNYFGINDLSELPVIEELEESPVPPSSDEDSKKGTDNPHH